MYFVATYKDIPSGSENRVKFRQEHIAFRMTLGTRMVLAGGLLKDDGQGTVGSLMVFEADSLEAAKTFAAGDPLVREGAFELVSVTPMRIAAVNPPPKAAPAH